MLVPKIHELRCCTNPYRITPLARWCVNRSSVYWTKPARN